MLKGKGPILQEDLEKLLKYQTVYKEVLQYLYNQLLEGRDIEPGEITVNVPALMFPYSDILITRTNEVQASTKRPEIPGEGFAVLKKLLCDDEVAELRLRGFDEAARARRKANRVLYR